MRLIDADALWNEFDNTSWYDNADRDEVVLPILDAAPTIDVERPTKAQFKRMMAQLGYEQVVHCKDCKHQESIEGYGDNGGYCVLHSSACAGYCGDGEYTRNAGGICNESMAR